MSNSSNSHLEAVKMFHIQINFLTVIRAVASSSRYWCIARASTGTLISGQNSFIEYTSTQKRNSLFNVCSQRPLRQQFFISVSPGQNTYEGVVDKCCYLSPSCRVSATAGSIAALLTGPDLLESHVGQSDIFPKFQGYPETTLPQLHSLSRKQEKISRNKISGIRKVGSTKKYAAKHFCTDQTVGYIRVMNQPVLVPPSFQLFQGRFTLYVTFSFRRGTSQFSNSFSCVVKWR